MLMHLVLSWLLPTAMRGDVLLLSPLNWWCNQIQGSYINLQSQDWNKWWVRDGSQDVQWYSVPWAQVQFISVTQLCLTLCNPWTAVHQASLSITNSRAYSNSCPLSWWCCLIILSSVVPFSSCLRSFPASGAFPKSQFFASGGQTIRVSASTSVLPMNIED